MAEPGGQSLQYAEPLEALYLPASHSWQHAMPPAALCLPAAHGTHGTPLGPEDPGLHTQSETTLLRCGECEWAGHGRHRDLSAAEYDPAWQGAHT